MVGMTSATTAPSLPDTKLEHTGSLAARNDQGDPADPAKQALVASITTALANVDIQLGSHLWSFHDPERRKALSRMRDFLQRIREGSDRIAPDQVAAIHAVVERAAKNDQRRGRDNAWDLAEELRRRVYDAHTDAGLLLLIQREMADDTGVCYRNVFGRELPSALATQPLAATFRADALEILRCLHDIRVERVRLDRARDRMWQLFMWKLTPVLAGLLLVLYLLQPDEQRAPVAIFAGAVGSMLSAVLRVRDGERRIQQIRRSMSLLVIQPLLGATTALVATWVSQAHLIAFDPTTSPSGLALLGFLAGYSEPFFLGTLNRLAEAATLKADNSQDAPKSIRKSKDDPKPRQLPT